MKNIIRSRTVASALLTQAYIEDESQVKTFFFRLLLLFKQNIKIITDLCN